jgi:hypothetical protein
VTGGALNPAAVVTHPLLPCLANAGTAGHKVRRAARRAAAGFSFPSKLASRDICEQRGIRSWRSCVWIQAGDAGWWPAVCQCRSQLRWWPSLAPAAGGWPGGWCVPGGAGLLVRRHGGEAADPVPSRPRSGPLVASSGAPHSSRQGAASVGGGALWEAMDGVADLAAVRGRRQRVISGRTPETAVARGLRRQLAGRRSLRLTVREHAASYRAVIGAADRSGTLLSTGFRCHGG